MLVRSLMEARRKQSSGGGSGLTFLSGAITYWYKRRDWIIGAFAELIESPVPFIEATYRVFEDQTDDVNLPLQDDTFHGAVSGRFYLRLWDSIEHGRKDRDFYIGSLATGTRRRTAIDISELGDDLDAIPEIVRAGGPLQFVYKMMRRGYPLWNIYNMNVNAREMIDTVFFGD